MIHFGFDLVKFLACEQPGSPRSIAAMLRNLPEGATFVAAMSAPGVVDTNAIESEPDPEREAFADRKFWTPERQLQAQLINAIQTLTRLTVKWEKNKAPEFPVVGPLAWRGEETTKQASPQKKHSVDDVFSRMMGR